MALYTTTNRKLNAIINSSKGGTFTTGFMTLIVVTAMIVFALLPAYTSITDKIANNELKQKYLDELITKRDVMDQLLLEYESNQELITEFEKNTFIRNNNELIVANIDSVATNSNTKLQSASFDKVEASKKDELANYSQFITQTFNFKFKGKAIDLLGTLRKLESFPIPMEFENISFSFKKDKQVSENVEVFRDEPLISMNMTGRFYFWKNEELNEQVVE